jgi:uncharacterized protein
MPRPHEPERTCVGCREAAPKGSLVRLVRSVSGEPAVDPTGRAPGRGAYLHRRPECVRAAVRRGALARALRASRPAEETRLIGDVMEGRGANA